MLMIRLQRIGRKNDPAYRVSVLERARAARTGRVVETLGSYNPKTKQFAVDETSIKEWIGHGAKPTATLQNLFIAKGIITGEKADSFPSSARKKAREAAAKAEAEAAAAKKAAADAEAVAAKEAEAAAVAAEAPSASEAQEAPVEEAVPAEEPAVEAAPAEAPNESQAEAAA
ncbi:MAG: 30S ribosomal protein S16 [Patescibacteria group bacterium]|nr:30S ribosomal protein S16 [Patescibacteria group bacterium]MDE1944052.1 30S ribosomal protein S16 [Patescibacteria group bacterium]MDE1944908.1 30S ribosomal protein S16 [Patescibacteria group bacterium]MDE2057338.1 30S ribosomal protein S16 [Patescibacteria group bacterium]